MADKPTYEELEETVKRLEKAYGELEWQVEERTGELMDINKQLQQEIIERQEAQEQLTLFHQFVETSREGMGWADLDGRVRYINPTLSRMFGEKKPEDSYGRSVLEYYSEETQRQLQEEIFPTVLLEGTWMGEMVIHSSTGSLIPTTNSLIVLRDAEGNPSSFANVLTDLTERKQVEDELRRHRDHLEELVAERTSSLKQSNQKLQQEITERKQAEEALQKSEEKYRLLADNVTDVIWVRDMNLHLTYISPSIMEQRGYTAEEAIARTPEEIWGQDSLKFIREVLTEELEIEKQEKKDLTRSRTLEVEVKCKDGSTIWTEAKMSFLRDQNGHPAEIIGVSRDISERKQTEEALRESEEKFRTLFDLSPQVVALTDVTTGKLIDVNNMFCMLTKYSKKEVLGMNTTEIGFYSEDDRARFIKELLTSEEVNGLEMDFKAKDGSILSAFMFARVIRISGKSFILTIFYNMTEQKRLQAQLQQAQKMESIGALAGGIAHDFNNILSPIILHTELVLEDISEKGPLKFSMEEIHRASLRAKDLVKQILTFSRQAEQERIPLMIYPVIKEALRLLRASLPSTIEIRQNIEAEDSVILADPTQVHQILMNLGTNAAIAMRKRGGVLKVGLVDVDLHSGDTNNIVVQEPGQYIKLTVSDTGHGIEPAIMDKIFDPYFTTQDKGKGTGLGLSVVHGIVNNHGGHISVYSKPDKETRFEVYLPLFDLAAIKAEMASPEKLATGDEHVLLVDDEKQIVDILQQILERLGYQVTARTSSVDALEMFRTASDKFDLVITDMTMPNMTGTRLAKELMNIRPDIPIIICTGFSEKINDEKAKAIGISGYIMKPVVISELAKKIREALD